MLAFSMGGVGGSGLQRIIRVQLSKCFREPLINYRNSASWIELPGQKTKNDIVEIADNEDEEEASEIEDGDDDDDEEEEDEEDESDCEQSAPENQNNC